MKMIRQIFSKREYRRPDTAKDWGMKRQSVQKVSAPLFSFHYVNDSIYLPEDELSESEKLQENGETMLSAIRRSFCLARHALVI